MSTEKGFLALRLEGPLQSWGFDSQFSRRNTALMPTKSGIAGICCAALGYSRGSEEEAKFLGSFAGVRMTAIAIPRNATKGNLSVRRLEDYHTVQNTMTADGKIKGTHITRRQYLEDATFGVLLEGGQDFLSHILEALTHPKWGIWLGRKSCIPSSPILAGSSNERGVKKNRDEALRLLIGDRSVETFTRQEEADDFSAADDSLMDAVQSFAIEHRRYSPRRVRVLQAREKK